jgi:hypothetical protein
MRAVLLGGLVLLTGCVVEHPIIVDYPCSGFKVGQTTEAEVISKCGQPESQMNSAGGLTLNFKNPGSALQIFEFDGNGVLKGYSGAQGSPLSIQPYSGR